MRTKILFIGLCIFLLVGCEILEPKPIIKIRKSSNIIQSGDSIAHCDCEGESYTYLNSSGFGCGCISLINQ